MKHVILLAVSSLVLLVGMGGCTPAIQQNRDTEHASDADRAIQAFVEGCIQTSPNRDAALSVISGYGLSVSGSLISATNMPAAGFSFHRVTGGSETITGGVSGASGYDLTRCIVTTRRHFAVPAAAAVAERLNALGFQLTRDQRRTPTEVRGDYAPIQGTFSRAGRRVNVTVAQGQTMDGLSYTSMYFNFLN